MFGIKSKKLGFGFLKEIIVQILKLYYSLYAII